MFRILSTGRIGGLITVAIAFCALPIVPVAAMPSRVAISAGSFFAAASQCEKENLITPGQTEALMKTLNVYISASDQRNIQSGYARGLKSSELYVVELKQWAPFTADPSSCYRVQGVLDEYKGQLKAE